MIISEFSFLFFLEKQISSQILDLLHLKKNQIQGAGNHFSNAQNELLLHI